MNRSARRLPALVLAAGVVAALAACTPPVTNLAGCDAPFAPGDNSNAVTASGKLGSEPRVEFPTPLVANDGQVTVLERGEGPVVYPTNAVELFISTFDPATGDPGSSTGYETSRLSIAADDVFAQFTQCVTAGSRISVVADAATVYGSADAATGAGINPTAVLVAVIDVVDTFMGKANGWDQFPEAGMPSVVLAPNGRPGILVPNEPAPEDFRVAVLKAGTGAAVEEDDEVVVQYTAVRWSSDIVTGSTWGGSGQTPAAPQRVTVDDAAPIPSLPEILVGKQVGSQVLAVVPQEDDALIYVIDILAIQD